MNELKQVKHLLFILLCSYYFVHSCITRRFRVWRAAQSLVFSWANPSSAHNVYYLGYMKCVFSTGNATTRCVALLIRAREYAHSWIKHACAFGSVSCVYCVWRDERKEWSCVKTPPSNAIERRCATRSAIRESQLSWNVDEISLKAFLRGKNVCLPD